MNRRTANRVAAAMRRTRFATNITRGTYGWKIDATDGISGESMTVYSEWQWAYIAGWMEATTPRR